MKQSKKIITVCSMVAAICFGICSFGSFFSERTAFGWIYALLAVAQLMLAVANLTIKNRTTDVTQPQSDKEEEK